LRGDFRGHAFIPLFGEPQAGRSVELLKSRLASAATVEVVEPPVAGLAFIATGGEVSEMLDTWWRYSVPGDRLPVLLMQHEPGLEAWAPDMDANLVVGVAREEERALYDGLPNVQPVMAQDARAVTEFAITAYPECFGGRAAAPTSPQAPAGVHEGSGTPFRPRTEPGQLPGQVWPHSGRPGSPPGPPPMPGHPAGVGGTPPAPPPRTSRMRDFRTLIDRATRIVDSGIHGAWMPEELTRLALSHQTGKIVGVTSRAGGVGKTAIAAALGIIYGEAVQDSGWCAAVVDQNIGNPDQWGRLSLNPQVRTVFQIMADIEAGREWTVPAWNRTPALAVYPERRDLGEGYAPGQIERFAAQLRQLHMLSVVDLPNRIPAFTSAEAAVCAGWAAVADLLLLPTTDDPTRLQGTIDYLDAPLVRGDPDAGYRPVRVVVPYVRSPLRAVREDPGVRSLLEHIRQRVIAVVEIPKNERATLAIVKGRPITEVDVGLRTAYVELALTVARALL
jgi:MinD-like ATPase involved in chromosome partitioning or flagellar assembly